MENIQTLVAIATHTKQERELAAFLAEIESEVRRANFYRHGDDAAEVDAASITRIFIMFQRARAAGLLPYPVPA